MLLQKTAAEIYSGDRAGSAPLACTAEGLFNQTVSPFPKEPLTIQALCRLWQSGKRIKTSVLSASLEVLTLNGFELVLFFLSSGKQREHLSLQKVGIRPTALITAIARGSCSSLYHC